MPAFWTTPLPGGVGQRIKAGLFNLAVTAIQELQDDTNRYFMESARSTNQSISAATWTTITTTVVSDPSGAYNGTVYTVPASGIYVCTTKVRPADASAANSICQGVNTSNVDGPWMAWLDTMQASTGKRTTITNTRILSCTAGDQLRLYTYADSAYTVQQASLVIYRLSRA